VDQLHCFGLSHMYLSLTFKLLDSNMQLDRYMTTHSRNHSKSSALVLHSHHCKVLQRF
jgi:hypothetical protein